MGTACLIMRGYSENRLREIGDEMCIDFVCVYRNISRVSMGEIRKLEPEFV